MENLPLANDSIRNRIYEVRGVKVMLDRDLAEMYEVETKMLNRQVKRNIERFPPDFMFQLTEREWEFLRCQTVTSNDSLRVQDGMLDENRQEILKCQNGTSSWGGVRRPPFAFTEQGVAMLSGVLRSERAVRVNIQIMRAFVAVRQALPQLATREDIDDLRSRIQLLESGVSALNDGEAAMRDEIDNIYRALNALQSLPDPEPIPPVGYQATLDRENNKKE